MLRRALILATLSGMAACGRDSAPTSQPSWWLGMDPFFKHGLGHEILTAEAVLRANQFIETRNQQTGDTGIGKWPYFDQTFILGNNTESGFHTLDPLVKGNFAVDMPGETTASPAFQGDAYNLAKVYGVPADQWHTSGKGQSLHFLRNFTGTFEQPVGVRPVEGACEDGRNRIIGAVRRAAETWMNEDGSLDENERRKRALFWTGVATHVIQDSFSSAHAKRQASSSTRHLMDICAYTDLPLDGVCHHDHKPVSGLDNIGGGANDGWSRFGSIRPEARDAVMATASFLVRMSRFFALADWSRVHHDTVLFEQYFMDQFTLAAEYFNVAKVDGYPEGSGWFRCQDAGSIPPAPDGSPASVTLSSPFTPLGDTFTAWYSTKASVAAGAFLATLATSESHTVVRTIGDEAFYQTYALPGSGARSGTVTFAVANHSVGAYDLRMYGSDGLEILSQSFTVGPGLRIMAPTADDDYQPQTAFHVGDAYTVYVEADPTWSPSAFVVITPVSAAFGDADAAYAARIAGAKLNGSATKLLSGTVPSIPGTYLARLFDGPWCSGAADPSTCVQGHLVSLAQFTVEAAP